jgi:hypothetical protein
MTLHAESLPIAAPSTAVDVTPWIAKILAACVAKGATITQTKGHDCYTSTCSFGTPSYRSYYDYDVKAWVTEGPVDDVIVHRAEWPLELIPGGYGAKRPTGPSIEALGFLLGIVREAPSGQGGEIGSLLIYERVATLRGNGDGGRGVVLAMGQQPSRVHMEDQRGVSHFRTGPDGSLSIGCFAGT